jgi:SHOCT-like protein
MNNDRRSVLQMLADGKINADEAERLLSALDRNGAAAPGEAPPPPRHNAAPKYLRVTVDADVHGDNTKVNIRVPMALLRAGVRLSSLIPPSAREQVNAEFAKNGVPFDIGQLKPENLEELISHLDDFSVDVDSTDAKVRVYCE